MRRRTWSCTHDIWSFHFWWLLMETLIPLVKLKGKSLSCNGRRKTFYDDGYMQGGEREERERGAVPSGAPLLAPGLCDLDFGQGLLLGGEWEGRGLWGCVNFPFALFPLSGRGFAGIQKLNPRQVEGLHISDVGHGTGQPWGQECSDVPAFLHRTALPLCCPRHSSRTRGAQLRLLHVDLAVRKIN